MTYALRTPVMSSRHVRQKNENTIHTHNFYNNYLHLGR